MNKIKIVVNRNKRKGIVLLGRLVMFSVFMLFPLCCFAQEFVGRNVMKFPNKKLKIERIEEVQKDSKWFMIDASCNDSLFTISSHVGRDPDKGTKLIVGNTYTMSLYGRYLDQFDIDAGFDRIKWGRKKIIKKDHRDIVFSASNLNGDRYVEHDELEPNEGVQSPQEDMSGTDAYGRQYVDLGLPSGTLWATCNVGADNPWEYGDYFAWGETTPKSCYWLDSYKWMACRESEPEDLESSDPNFFYKTKYVYSNAEEHWDVGQGELLPEDDAATVCWGNEWCMPTEEQVFELAEKSYTAAGQYVINGVKGFKVTSRFNGNSIFLPFGGDFYLDERLYVGEQGSFWSRKALKNNTGSYCLRVQGAHVMLKTLFGRFCGMNIRPVRVKKQK